MVNIQLCEKACFSEYVISGIHTADSLKNHVGMKVRVELFFCMV